jgi:hypothetical protein
MQRDPSAPQIAHVFPNNLVATHEFPWHNDSHEAAGSVKNKI